MSHSVIVYYSFMGNTKIVADYIQQRLLIPSIAIQELKPRSRAGIGKAAITALLGLKSKINSEAFNVSPYETIYLGAQVWAGKTTPAINAFLKGADLRGKRVRLFVTKADPKSPDRVIEALKKRIEKSGGTLIDYVHITTPGLDEDQKHLELEDFKDIIDHWIT